jgi:hypothetical protein
LSLSYRPAKTNDPGPFVSLVADELPAALGAPEDRPAKNITTAPNGDITLTFTGTLQSANDLKGPLCDVEGAVSGTFTIPKASQITQHYFRAKATR